MFAPLSITIAVVSVLAAGLIFYWVARLLARRAAKLVEPQDDSVVRVAAVNERYRAAADAATARLIKALQAHD